MILLASIISSASFAQNQKGTKERIKIFSQAIDGNLIGDPAEREVTVYLPPSYKNRPEQRYPVLYMLHGFTDNDSQWFGWEEHWINLHEVIDMALSEGLSKEMIVVMPNAYNRFKGSMYSSSVTIGDWETFISKELVKYIDSHYRTLPNTESRGLAGHSMGGYGTIRLAMKFPEVWSSIYLLSPCCMDRADNNTSEEIMKNTESIQHPDQLESLKFFESTRFASASAWSPNPEHSPLFLDLPYQNGEIRPDVVDKWSANRILNMVDQYVFNLKKITAIGLDVGHQDYNISKASQKLHEMLDTYQIPHLYETYEGNHINRVAERIRTKVLPFFSENLVF